MYFSQRVEGAGKLDTGARGGKINKRDPQEMLQGEG